MKTRFTMILALFLPALASAAELRPEDIVSCINSYGVIAEAAFAAKHDGMAQWANERVGKLLPQFREVSGTVEGDRMATTVVDLMRAESDAIKREGTQALREEDVGKMRQLIGRRAARCDALLGIPTYSLPMTPNPKHFTSYERGYQAACIDVQQRANQDNVISDRQIGTYCYCQTSALAIYGIDERTPLDVAKARADQTRESCRRLALDDRT